MAVWWRESFTRILPPRAYTISLTWQTRDVWRQQDECGLKEPFQKGWNESDYICKPLQNSIFIDSNGDLYPCISLYYKFGNILQQPLRDIWNKSEKHKYILSLKKKDFSICTACETKEYCSKCPGNALLEKGDCFACSTLDKRLSTIAKEMYAAPEETAVCPLSQKWDHFAFSILESLKHLGRELAKRSG